MHFAINGPALDLPPRLAETYQSVLEHCWETNGIPPTIRELMETTRASSTSVVNGRLDRLAARGFIRRSRETGRGIQVVGATWTPPRWVKIVHDGAEKAEAA